MDSMVQLYVRFLLHPLTRYIFAWIVALNAAGLTLLVSWTAFNQRNQDGTPLRRDGNFGHTLIDFGGQWVMGRMLVEGKGRQLYDRNVLREVVTRNYPEEDEVPIELRDETHLKEHDATNLMGWFVGHDDQAVAVAKASLLTSLASDQPLAAVVLSRSELEDRDERLALVAQKQIGGALYPPINAFIMAPVAMLKPATGYHLVQAISIALGLLTALGVRVITRGRIWWPVAITAIVLYPGFSSGLNLAQNHILSVTFLIWGWALLTLDRPVCGGIFWGLLAFKPVWAATFFLVPLVTRRWRFCAAMLLTGGSIVLLTLPWVGVQTWFDWLHVGGDATRVYENDYNWIFLSRDLLGIPRRWLLDFHAPYYERNNWPATFLGWTLLALVLLSTLFVAWRRNSSVRALSGDAPAFLFLGAWLCCFHFMFYDVLLTSLPVFLLLAEPRCYLEPLLLAIGGLGQSSGKAVPSYYRARLATAYPWSPTGPSPTATWIGTLNSMTLSLLVIFLITDLAFPSLGIAVSVSAPLLDGAPFPLPLKYSTAQLGTPWNTFTLMLLWLWCGWLTLRGAKSGGTR
jgi:hypothetical protein